MASSKMQDPRQLAFLKYYLTPGTELFNNALQSALKAGYTQEYSENILQPTLKEQYDYWTIGKSRRHKHSYIYILHSLGYYKIGLAYSLYSRITSLQSGNPYPLMLVGAFEHQDAKSLEKQLHAKYTGKKHRGEWFKLTTEDIEEIMGEFHG